MAVKGLKGLFPYPLLTFLTKRSVQAQLTSFNHFCLIVLQVSEFLAHMSLDADAVINLPGVNFGVSGDNFSFKLPQPPSLPSMLPPLEMPSPKSNPRPTPQQQKDMLLGEVYI